MVRLFDPHIHMYSRTTDDYELMSKAGIEVVVEPSFWLGSLRTSVGTFIDYWEHIITFETKRAKEYGISHFVCISVNPKESMNRPLALDAIEPMIKYLDRENVVAVGELGYNLINDLEEEIFVKQMETAIEKNMLIMIHLPHHNKREGLVRIENLMNNNSKIGKYDRKKILIDHNTEETIKNVLEMGVYAGLTVYPFTKLSPERAINIIKIFGSDRIMINSSADWGPSDPLSVPTVSREMRKKNINRNDIENVTFFNAYEFYKQSPRFTWSP
ncbi:MAG: TatD family hydrolase [Candidatus Nitrosocosmicus sp.]